MPVGERDVRDHRALQAPPLPRRNHLANIPAAGTEGRYFHATDIFKVYRDNGVSWDLVAVGLDGSSLLNLAWLGTGTPDNTKFLRGDATWAVPAGGSGVTEAFVIAMATAL
jgi:hypothetical protein